MPTGDQELERLKRLRERQLADRDPHVKDRQFQRMSAAREKKIGKQSYSLKRMWGDIPHVWKGLFYGLVLGTLVFIVLPFFWTSSWVFPCSLAAIIFFAIFGAVVGNAVDAREEIKRLMR